jgi:PAS domain S-box-containing protein
MDKTYKSRKELIREIAELKEKLADKKIFQDHISGYAGITSDILNRNEVLLAESQKLSHTGSWYLDLTTNTITWSDEVYRIFGAGQPDFESTFESFLEFVHPDDRLTVNQAYRDSLSELGDTSELVHRIIQRNSGNVVYVLEKSINVRSAEGIVVALIGIVQDITNIKKIQDDLTEKNSVLKLLLNNLNGVAYLCNNDSEWTMKFISDGIFDLSGYKPELFIDNRVMGFNSIIYEDDRQRVWDDIQKSITEKNNYTIEYRIVTSTGQIKWVWEKGRGIFDGDDLLSLEGFISDYSETKVAQLKLEESETHYRHLADDYRILFHNNPEAMYIIDKKDFRIIEANSAALRLYGYTREEFLSLKLHDIRPEEDIPILYKKFESSTSTLGNLGELRHKRKGGEVFWVVIRYHDLIYNGSDARHVSVTDITSRRIAEDLIMELNTHLEEKVKQRTAELEHFFSVAPDMLCIADLSGNFIKLNRSWEDVLGYPLAELARKKFLELVHPDDMQSTLEAMETLGGQERVTNFINRYRTSNGSYRYFEWRSVPVGYLIYAAARDITSRIEAESEIKTARAEAERANNAKSRFLANMSHEIRTPMNAILGYSELLTSMVHDKTQIEFLKSIRTSGKTLLSLINNILDLSKIEAGKIELELDYINSASFFQEFERIFLVKIKEKGLTFVSKINADIPSYLYTDGLRLRQIILNLINNAVKFTERGEITFSVHTRSSQAQLEREAGVVKLFDLVITVSDTGIGIPEELHDKIFASFYQIKGTDIQTGTGLGLSITMGLVQMMKGNITLRSKPGEGSTFIVTIPEIYSRENYNIELPVDKVDPSAIFFTLGQVLIVDDIEENRKIIKDALRDTSLTLLEAEDGEAALEILDKTVPDLVITDIRMPHLDGFGLLINIKKNERLKNIPVIAYSASVMKEEQELISKSDFAGLLIKPIQISVLYKELIKFLPYNFIEKPIDEVQTEQACYQTDIADYPEMMSELEGRLTEEWKCYENRQPIGKVKKFGKEIMELGSLNNCEQVKQYGERLVFATESFNIADILTLLKRFPELISHLKQ